VFERPDVEDPDEPLREPPAAPAEPPALEPFDDPPIPALPEELDEFVSPDPEPLVPWPVRPAPGVPEVRPCEFTSDERFCAARESPTAPL